MSALVGSALRGVFGSMAMTGCRVLATEVGWLEQPPPQQVFRERVPEEQSRAVEEVVHWLYGALGGAAFGLLPDSVRHAPGAGPAYGVAAWLGFEIGIAPLLDLSHHERHGLRAHVALLADHAVYGAILSADR